MPIWFRGTINPSDVGTYNPTTKELTVTESVVIYPDFTLTKPVSALLSGAPNLSLRIISGGVPFSIGSPTTRWSGKIQFG